MREEILRRQALGQKTKAIARDLKISKNTVKKYLAETAEESETKKNYSPAWASQVCWQEVDEEIRRGVALQHYLEERVELAKEIPYTSFWREYRRRNPKLDFEFHKIHPPGERAEIDFKGRDTPELGFFDRATGERIECQLFGSILCSSQLFFAEAHAHEKQMDWFQGMENSFHYFGGVPRILVMDNARAMISRADWWDPDHNPEFFRICEHFKIAATPARPREPKDKNLIEGALGIFWRWARPKISQRKFFSPSELNLFLRELSDDFNLRVQKKYGESRRARFNREEKSLLQSLPEQAFEIAEWKKAKLHPDCHLQVKKNFYSAPFRLRGEELSVRITPSFIEVFHRLERVALHQTLSAHSQGRYITEDAHLPAMHQALKEMTPQNILNEAKIIGEQTHAIIFRLVNEGRHPLQYLRRCQGILRLKNRYGAARLENCARILNDLHQKMPRLSDLEALLKNPKLEHIQAALTIRKENPNLRGQKHWRLT
jgi:transposase